jgi:hypothetical protein
MEHGLTGLNEGGKVQDAFERSTLSFGGCEKLIQRGPIGQISLNKIDIVG